MKNITETERAISDILRGQPVILSCDNAAIVAMSAEFITYKSIEYFRNITSGNISLIVTANRASAIFPDKMFDVPVKISLQDNTTIEEILSLSAIGVVMPNYTPSLCSANDIERDAIQLAKHSELIPAVIVADVLGDINEFARTHDILTVKTQSVKEYEENIADEMRIVCKSPLTLKYAKESSITVFRAGSKEHYAIIIGNPMSNALIRIHSSCYTGDLLNSLKCDCRDQLHEAIEFIANEGDGIILYLMQEGRGIGLVNKLRAYALQADGLDTVDANEFLGFDDDERPYTVAASMLEKLGLHEVRLMTNNKRKVNGLEKCGIKVTERVSHIMKTNEHNSDYIATKFTRLGHLEPT